MQKGNILVIGNSGVGKSTLINAVLGDERAETGWGSTGTTGELKLYSNDELPFNIIDSIGFEPSLINRTRAIWAVKRWSRESASDGGEKKQINAIWYCVDGASRKLFPESIASLTKATKMWESVPVIVVITKSVAKGEQQENIQMAHNAFAQQKRYSANLKKVIPVVAQAYQIDDDMIVEPRGIAELIDATNALLPEGVRAAEKDVKTYKLKRKRAMARGVTATCAVAGAGVAAVPIPIPDAAPLSAIEVGEIEAISRIYKIEKNEDSSALLQKFVEVSAASVAGKTVLNALKAVPGINLAASAVNAVAAACIITALGEGSRYAFEQVYLGNKKVDDLEWVDSIVNGLYSSKFMEKAEAVLKNLSELGCKDISARQIVDVIVAVFGRSATELK